jgi:DNA-binding NarL/FixJ family response regulator
MPESLRVVVADDHQPVRMGIRELLADTDDIVVVMAINMPMLSGVEATRQIQAAAPRKLIALPHERDSNEPDHN